MKNRVRRHLLVLSGWFFVLLAVVGVVLPFLPTTPFLILALTLFARSSPAFHRMLLNNRWFGASLKQWEERKSVSLRTKRRATVLVLLSFSILIAILYERVALQILLAAMAMVLLLFIWRLKQSIEASPMPPRPSIR